MAQSFEQRRIQKTYLAMVTGRPPRQGVIDQPLSETRGRVRAERSGKPALTEFKRLRAKGDYAILELQPHHGRKHQLRVHCASRNWPIVGDRLYGGEASERMWLHAWRLRFQHPVSGLEFSLECPSFDQWGLFGRIAGGE